MDEPANYAPADMTGQAETRSPPFPLSYSAAQLLLHLPLNELRM